ncbi:MAG: response regulator [Bacteroidia bacterium]|nr:response regulator [Bacteroidia bacterium]
MSRKNTILIAEDEPMMLKVLEFKLRKDGYEVMTASNGKDAIEKIKNTPPDLLITDMTLPFFNGLEIIDYVRKNGTPRLPVIILTDVDKEAVILEAFKTGANDFITKPFSPNELSIRVKRYLSEV